MANLLVITSDEICCKSFLNLGLRYKVLSKVTGYSLNSFSTLIINIFLYKGPSDNYVNRRFQKHKNFSFSVLHFVIHVQSFPVMGGNSYSLWICSEGRMYHCTGCYKICAKKLRCHPGLQFPFECQNTTSFHMGVSFTEMHELRLTSFVHRISREIVIHDFLRSQFCSLMSNPVLTFLCAWVFGIG